MFLLRYLSLLLYVDLPPFSCLLKLFITLLLLPFFSACVADIHDKTCIFPLHFLPLLFFCSPRSASLFTCFLNLSAWKNGKETSATQATVLKILLSIFTLSLLAYVSHMVGECFFVSVFFFLNYNIVIGGGKR